MSDGTDPSSLAIGAGVTGAVGLALAFIRGLFSRNVTAADKAQEEMRADVKNILLELRSMHDTQTRQESSILAINKEVTLLAATCKAAHDRIDALISVPPRAKR